MGVDRQLYDTADPIGAVGVVSARKSCRRFLYGHHSLAGNGTMCYASACALGADGGACYRMQARHPRLSFSQLLQTGISLEASEGVDADRSYGTMMMLRSTAGDSPPTASTCARTR